MGDCPSKIFEGYGRGNEKLEFSKAVQYSPRCSR